MNNKPQAYRYANLSDIIVETKARKIMEIGTAAGKRATLMIRAAQSVCPQNDCVEYTGFDLFEDPPAEELSPRIHPPSKEVVQNMLKEAFPRECVVLFKGDTKMILKNICSVWPEQDLIFIDGGHHEDTVRSDWDSIQPIIGANTTVVFDDYWNYPGGGGCNDLIHDLQRNPMWNVELLEPIDRFPRSYGELCTQLVKVTK